MAKYYEIKCQKQQPIPYEKKEKTKKPVKKREKLTKKWFLENAYDINMAGFLEKNGDANMEPKHIYSKYLMDKKDTFSDELYEIVDNYYIDSKKPKRIALLD